MTSNASLSQNANSDSLIYFGLEPDGTDTESRPELTGVHLIAWLHDVGAKHTDSQPACRESLNVGFAGLRQTPLALRRTLHALEFACLQYFRKLATAPRPRSGRGLSHLKQLLSML